jgi:hypothetical protein
VNHGMLLKATHGMVMLVFCRRNDDSFRCHYGTPKLELFGAGRISERNFANCWLVTA